MARGKSNAKKNIKFARGKVDKAQTKLIQMNSKKINELLGETEDKYNITASNGLTEIAFPSMQTAANRRLQIFQIPIGALVGTSDTTRIGDRISLKTIQLRLSIAVNKRGCYISRPVQSCALSNVLGQSTRNITRRSPSNKPARMASDITIHKCGLNTGPKLGIIIHLSE